MARGILEHMTTAKERAFNNMLNHIRQRGTERTYDKRAGRETPVVQMVRTGDYIVGFISYNIKTNSVVGIDSFGVVQAKPGDKLVNISYACAIQKERIDS